MKVILKTPNNNNNSLILLRAVEGRAMFVFCHSLWVFFIVPARLSAFYPPVFRVSFCTFRLLLSTPFLQFSHLCVALGSSENPAAALATAAAPPPPQQQAVVRAADLWPRHSCSAIARPLRPPAIGSFSWPKGHTPEPTLNKTKSPKEKEEKRRRRKKSWIDQLQGEKEERRSKTRFSYERKNNGSEGKPKIDGWENKKKNKLIIFINICKLCFVFVWQERVRSSRSSWFIGASNILQSWGEGGPGSHRLWANHFLFVVTSDQVTRSRRGQVCVCWFQVLSSA